jgi:hypothetical protein
MKKEINSNGMLQRLAFEGVVFVILKTKQKENPRKQTRENNILVCL